MFELAVAWPPGRFLLTGTQKKVEGRRLGGRMPELGPSVFERPEGTTIRYRYLEYNKVRTVS
jgi:hypothetical protein